MLFRTLIIVLSLFYAICSYGGVYKCKDNKGHVIFSDTSCSAKESKFIDVDALKKKQLRRASNIINAQSTASKPGRFHCDARTRYSQMTPCEEAVYFLNNCPNTKMDGVEKVNDLMVFPAKNNGVEKISNYHMNPEL